MQEITWPILRGLTVRDLNRMASKVTGPALDAGEGCTLKLSRGPTVLLVDHSVVRDCELGFMDEGELPECCQDLVMITLDLGGKLALADFLRKCAARLADGTGDLCFGEKYVELLGTDLRHEFGFCGHKALRDPARQPSAVDRITA